MNQDRTRSKKSIKLFFLLLLTNVSAYIYIYHPDARLYGIDEIILDGAYQNTGWAWLYQMPTKVYKISYYLGLIGAFFLLITDYKKMEKTVASTIKKTVVRLRKYDDKIFETCMLLMPLLLLLTYASYYNKDFDDGEVVIPTIAKGLLSFWDYPRDVNALLAEEYTEVEEGETLVPYTSWGPLHLYLVALSFKILGISDFSARLPSLLFGFGTIFLAYIICKNFLKKRDGYLTILLLIISPMFIRHSLDASFDIPMTFFFASSSYYLMAYLKTNSRRYAALSGLLLGAGFWIKHTLTLAALPALFYLRRKKGAKLFFGFFFCAVIALLLYFGYTTGFLFSLQRTIKQALRYFRNEGPYYGETSTMVLAQFIDLNYPVLLLSVFGFFSLLKSKEKYRRYLATLTPLLFLMMLLSSTKTLRHFVMLVPLFTITASVGFRYLSNKKMTVIAVILLLLHAQLFIAYRTMIFANDSRYSDLAQAFEKNYKLLGCNTRSIGYYASMEYYSGSDLAPGEFQNIMKKDSNVRYLILCDDAGAFPNLDTKELNEIKEYAAISCKKTGVKNSFNGLYVFDCRPAG